jgi:hypothetical protein
MKKCNFVYEADHVNNIIYVDVDSMKRAGQIDAPEYERFLVIKAELPGYVIKTKEFEKKEKCTYKGLRFDVMQAFIIYHEKDVTTRDARLKELLEKIIEGTDSGSAIAPAKHWFIEKYKKEYKESPLSKLTNKRESLVEKLLEGIPSELITVSKND